MKLRGSEYLGSGYTGYGVNELKQDIEKDDLGPDWYDNQSRYEPNQSQYDPERPPISGRISGEDAIKVKKLIAKASEKKQQLIQDQENPQPPVSELSTDRPPLPPTPEYMDKMKNSQDTEIEKKEG